MRHWQLLSILLQYPDADVLAAHDELAAAGRGHPRIETFLSWQGGTPLAQLEAAYVRTFDFDRRASLYLTYHTYGDRRQRGLELVRLKRLFADADLSLTGTELPDYLPVVLEFAALSPKRGQLLLTELRAPLELVRSRLHEMGSPYSSLLDEVVASLPRPSSRQVELARRLAAEGPPSELVGLEPFAEAAS